MSSSAPSGVPLAVGTTFVYHSRDSLSGLPIVGERAAPDSDFVVRVTGDTLDLDGTRWAIIDQPDRAFGSSGIGPYYANGAGGVYRLEARLGTAALSGVALLIFAYPAPRGTVMQFGPTVTATDTVITVAAGTFHCYRYDLVSQPSRTDTSWTVFLAPGTGVVQRIQPIASMSDAQGHLTARHDRIFRLTSIQRP
ncbi:MAG TPA: hypothetical protein VGM50_09625 [Gemmatimonadaceae bacterium]